MKASFVNTAVNPPDIKLTPKELVKRHMFNQQHTITEEEWTQLQVGNDTDLPGNWVKSKAFAFITSND